MSEKTCFIYLFLLIYFFIYLFIYLFIFVLFYFILFYFFYFFFFYLFIYLFFFFSSYSRNFILYISIRRKRNTKTSFTTARNYIFANNVLPPFFIFNPDKRIKQA